jgi:hypothetical protein
MVLPRHRVQAPGLDRADPPTWGNSILDRLRGFTRLAQLTDRCGLLEHAEASGVAAPSYRTVDAARALDLVLHEHRPPPQVSSLAVTYLAFLEQAVRPDGRVFERLTANHHWSDHPDRDQSWGWSVVALGAATRTGGSQAVRDRAAKAFLRVATARSSDARACALATLGAVALVRARTDYSGAAHSLLADCLEAIPRNASSGWAWPEARLEHNNALLCDALIVGGRALGHSVSVRQGLALLSVLMDIETGEGGHLSPTGDLGRGVHEGGPRGPQRPADVAAIADACAHAFGITGDLQWRRGVRLARNWFLGVNDLSLPVYDPDTGIARDSLSPTPHASGAEATLAALSTLQRAQEVGVYEGRPSDHGTARSQRLASGHLRLRTCTT